MQYMGQMFDYASAEATCQKTRYRKHVCDDFDRGTGKGATSFYLWQNQPCKLQVQVDPNGLVSIYQPNMGSYSKTSGRDRPLFKKDSNNWFTVRWEAKSWPRAELGCATNCEVWAASCICDHADLSG